jgi:hypothetical protein
MITSAQDYFYERTKFIYSTGATFTGGNRTVNTVYDLCSAMALSDSNMTAPTTGGTLTVNSQALGSYDYVIKTGEFVLDTFTAADWFTSTNDSVSAFVVVRGNLTIPENIIFAPPARKLFTAIYVDGNLTVNGSVSMSARGANHSTAGSNIAATEIRIANGTFSGVTNPSVPASGGAGGLGGVDPDGSWGASGPGLVGGAGTGGGTGGGSGGTHYLPWISGGSAVRGGDGSAGTSFSGGASGGSLICSVTVRPNGGVDGAHGGDSRNYYGSAFGGAGNPTGTGAFAVWPGPSVEAQDVGFRQVTGTGGVLFVFVTGTYSGSGAVESRGSHYGSGGGGGSVTVMAKVDSGPTPNAQGGGLLNADQNGGVGTARKLALP